MGVILHVQCDNCEFSRKVLFGAGFENFGTVCNVPAINEKTGKFVVKNIFLEEKATDNLVFYNDPIMYKGEIDKDEIQWGDIYLKSTENLCPKCRTFSLNFNNCGCFD